jgi:Ca2+-transporting ATPase
VTFLLCLFVLLLQLLWINLIMDTLGALALATEEPTDDLMERKPVGKTEPLISNVMWRNIFGQAAYQIIVFMTFNFVGKKILKLSGTSDEQTLMNNTVIFNAFVFCQVFNEINARRPEKLNVFQGIYKNYVFLSIIGITVVFQVCKNLFLTPWRTCVPFGSVFSSNC